MKRFLPLLLLIAVLGCKKSTNDSLLLRKIETASIVYQTFEYNAQGKLAKENSYFSMCSTPVDEHTYIYNNGKLDKIQSRLRSLYSSTQTMCNPASGITSEEQYEYDNHGRILKVTRPGASYTVFTYDSRNRVAKHVLYLPSGVAHDSTTYDYDARGNISQVSDNQGQVTNYTYDNKRNPFYRIGQKPGWISAFNSSPNNVLKATGSLAFERKILKYVYDYPTLVEENGVVYTYVYQ